jgi:hypothetical protein
MKLQTWNPHFIDSSALYSCFEHLKCSIVEMQQWPTLSELNQLLARQGRRILARSGKEICFVPPVKGKQPFERQYEANIFLTGEVQTRTNNWHDFFNALVWQIFPRAKSTLNLLHYHMQLLEAQNHLEHRCALRDAATLFDESGIIVVSTKKALIRLLKDFQWKELFWQRREEVLSCMRFFVFGHALYEKALHPYSGMTGKGILFHVEEMFLNIAQTSQLQELDSMVASFLSGTLSSSADLMPIPLLGYPGWVEANHNEAYYDNKRYFRDKNKPDCAIA